MVILLVCDYAIGQGLMTLFYSQRSGENYRTRYALNEMQAQVVVFGNSQARHHYDPEVFEGVLQRSFYNAGRDGQSIFYDQALFTEVLKRYVPQIVLLNVTPPGLYQRQEDYERLSAVLPFTRGYPAFKQLAFMRGKFEVVKMLSRIYPFNSLLLTMLADHFRQEKGLRGFEPLVGVMSAPRSGARYSVATQRNLDPLKVKAYQKFIAEAKEHGVALFLIVAPIYEHYYQEFEEFNEKSLAAIQELASLNDVPFLDLTYASGISDHLYFFKDWSHLNVEGARMFSVRVADFVHREMGVTASQASLRAKSGANG